MRMRHAAVVAGLALGLMSGAANASYIVDFRQVAGNVVATGSGSLQLGGLSDFGGDQDSAFLIPYQSSLAVGAGSSGELYSGNSLTPAFGSGGLSNPNVSTGNLVGLFGSRFIQAVYVPTGYTSGGALLSSSTWVGATFNSLGLKEGSYTSTWASDSFTVNVISPVPLPASAPMFGAALLALGSVGFGLKRKSKATAAA